MVEYALLVAKTSTATLGSFTSSALVWLSRLNWELVGYVALGLVAVWLVTWAFKLR